MNNVTPYQLDTDDRLLLVEAFHRTANEATSALAALRLIKAARGSRNRWRMLEAALQRLEGFGEVNRLLSLSFGRTMDLGQALARMTQAVVSGRMAAGGGRLIVDLPRTEVDGETARNLLLIAYELVANSVRHVLEPHGGELIVRLRRSDSDLILDVEDDGPGLNGGSGTSGTGLGSGIVAELVRRCGGRLECISDARGAAHRVHIPSQASQSRVAGPEAKPHDSSPR